MQNMMQGLQKDLGILEVFGALHNLILRVEQLEKAAGINLEPGDQPQAAAAPQEAAMPEPVKEPRPKKTQIKKALEIKEATTPTPEPVKETPPVVAKDEPIDLAFVRSLMVRVVKLDQVKGRDAVLAVLSSHGVAHVQDLDTDDYPVVVSELQAILTKGAV